MYVPALPRRHRYNPDAEPRGMLWLAFAITVLVAAAVYLQAYIPLF